MRAFLFQQKRWQQQPTTSSRNQPVGLSFLQQLQQSCRWGRGRGTAPNSTRAIALLLGSEHAKDYNKALKLYRNRNGETSGFNLSYLKHAQHLESIHFPHYWRQGIDQAYLSATLPDRPRLLVCFTGRARALNMSIPCFHATARHHFDGLVYFVDRENDFYFACESALLKALDSLCELAPWHRVALLGTSAGGVMALRLEASAPIGRRLAASPPVLRDSRLLARLQNQGCRSLRHSRIFYASENPIDTPHYNHLRTTLPAHQFRRCVFDLSWASRSHGTLATVMQLGALDQQLRWLAEQDAPKELPTRSTFVH